MISSIQKFFDSLKAGVRAKKKVGIIQEEELTRFDGMIVSLMVTKRENHD